MCNYNLLIENISIQAAALKNMIDEILVCLTRKLLAFLVSKVFTLKYEYIQAIGIQVLKTKT